MAALPKTITRLLDVPEAEDVQRAAEHLAELMKAIHGGEWRIQVDFNSKFVLVVLQ